MWNMEEKKIQGFEQAVRVLPLRLRQEAMALPADQRARVEELRLRWGRPMAAVLPEGERPLGGGPVTGQELEQLLELASRASFHTVADQLRRGYLTVEGGHRVGLCVESYHPQIVFHAAAYKHPISTAPEAHCVMLTMIIPRSVASFSWRMNHFFCGAFPEPKVFMTTAFNPGT